MFNNLIAVVILLPNPSWIENCWNGKLLRAQELVELFRIGSRYLFM